MPCDTAPLTTKALNILASVLNKYAPPQKNSDSGVSINLIRIKN